MEYAFVAFIDILGFSQMVSQDCSDPDQKYTNLNKLKNAIGRINDRYSNAGVNIVQFSDSIVISVKYDTSLFFKFVSVCADLQSFLLKSNILCRGGITLGRHYHSGNFLFSEGLVEAYHLENQHARYPRIAISADLIELLMYNGKIEKNICLLRDVDGVVFIDYLSYISSTEILILIRYYKQYLDQQNVSVSEKIRWVLGYAAHKFELEQDCLVSRAPSPIV